LAAKFFAIVGVVIRLTPPPEALSALVYKQKASVSAPPPGCVY